MSSTATLLFSLALAQGFNAFLPVYDGGIDFVLHRERDGQLRKVQPKARWTIDRKYVDRDIWIAFPHDSSWYLVPHDQMVEEGERHCVTQTNSWIKDGSYSRTRLSAEMVKEYEPYRFAGISEVAASAAEEGAE
ncbi:MAG TPA: hypothetical protein VMF50_07870 [Candidatus Binataceae bacterium]|nr:hypothetical protein [Candidatus Binataceae bacterium]